MPAYGTPQSGGIRGLAPGEYFTLLDGTEASSAMASVPCARGYSGGQSMAPLTFWGIGMTSETITVEGSNTDVDADYGTIGTLAATGSPAGDKYYTDTAAHAFYRVRKTGGTATVKVQR